jgi:putative transposase
MIHKDSCGRRVILMSEKNDTSKNHKACKYRLYPTDEQKILFNKTFGCRRFVYNSMLDIQNNRLKNGQFRLSKYDAFKYMTANIKPEYDWLKEVDSTALMNAVFDLDSAFSRYKAGIANKPKFKSKHKSRKSYTATNVNNSVTVSDKYVKLPKLGLVKAKIHRNIPDNAKIKSATVSMDGDGKYYVSVCFEYDKTDVACNWDKSKVIGLDYSSASLYVDSDGNRGDTRFFNKYSKRLAKEQRKLARKVGSKKDEPKSKNFIKQLHKVNKVHTKIANCRKDYHHKTANEITNRYDVICVEDIKFRKVLNHYKFKSYHRVTMDNAGYQFYTILEYKANDKGRLFMKSDEDFKSTQLCSDCGYENPELKDDSIRKWVCPCCNAIHDRDINAAINLKNFAIAKVFG